MIEEEYHLVPIELKRTFHYQLKHKSIVQSCHARDGRVALLSTPNLVLVHSRQENTTEPVVSSTPLQSVYLTKEGDLVMVGSLEVRVFSYLDNRTLAEQVTAHTLVSQVSQEVLYLGGDCAVVGLSLGNLEETVWHDVTDRCSVIAEVFWQQQTALLVGTEDGHWKVILADQSPVEGQEVAVTVAASHAG